MKFYYHPISSYCQKVMVALYEKGLEFEPEGARRCRKYALIQTQPMAPRVYPAIACWNKETAKWLVPGLDDSAAPVAAVR